jgi:hypothetical protein
MDNGYGPNDGAGIVAVVFAVYAAVIAFALFLALVVYVLNGFAFMRLFRKVGIEPWAAWVPIFINWRILELGGQAGWLSLLALVNPGGIVAAVFEAIGSYRTGIAFRKPGSYVVLFIFLPFVWAFILGSENEVYEPDLIRQAGYGPPLAGYGSAQYFSAHQAQQPAPPAPPAA